MPDKDRLHPQDDGYQDDGQPSDGHSPTPPDDANSSLPASLIFMEMMRQAAAKSSPPPPAPPAWAVNKEGEYTQMPTGDRLSPSAALSGVAVPDRFQEELEVQRIRRVKRRKARRRTRTVGALGGLVGTFLIVVVAAGLMATIFTWWTSPGFLDKKVRSDLQVALATSQVTVQPTGLPTPNWLRRIGIVSGHRGPENDPGAVCPDGLTEREVNENVATLVVRNLRGRGYSVDLLDEFDPRLDNFQAAALVSIHSNTCQDWGEVVSGYLVAKAAARPEGGEDVRLAECVAQHYGQATGLERRLSLTVDMTNYHTFREIHPLTPAAIIELGFLRADRQLLTEQPDLLARAITDGILCFLEPGELPVPPVESTPVSS